MSYEAEILKKIFLTEEQLQYIENYFEDNYLHFHLLTLIDDLGEYQIQSLTDLKRFIDACNDHEIYINKLLTRLEMKKLSFILKKIMVIMH